MSGCKEKNTLFILPGRSSLVLYKKIHANVTYSFRRNSQISENIGDEKKKRKKEILKRNNIENAVFRTSNENIPLVMKMNGKNLKNLAKKIVFIMMTGEKKIWFTKEANNTIRWSSVQEKHERRGCG